MTCIPFNRKLLFFTAIVTFALGACRKESSNAVLDTAHNNIRFAFMHHNRIKVNQAIAVYDSTFIKDSIDFVSPPTDKYYFWEVIPANGCDSVMDNKGITGIAFKCSGTYFITAKIYDSVTQDLIATTDTLEINVTSDTLYPSQPVLANDTLQIQTGLAKSHSATGDEVWLYLNVRTTQMYINNNPNDDLDYTSNITAGSYSFVFSNEIRSNSYPFNWTPYDAAFDKSCWISIKNLSYGVPALLSITWLGITYTGTITLIDENNYTFNWDNSGAVIMR